ncbi:MAG: 3-deoxy-D-manno-octulosonic acid transferase [Bacteroidetes bacterium HGW-Bacteroidetes-2]|jgi:3-deoxy-D-manno-octulosonic-acid transferase|nr:MAG: 3-deoxy-D-manno-octulosonic acid transferase [Bacteroidetes bacterium HGW-Bacteroidetes-2]
MQIVYTILVHIGAFAVWFSQFFSPKMKLFVCGRKEVFGLLKREILPEDKTIWMHCASLGEYEQGLPVLKGIRKEFSDYKIVLSFFSPSGYEVKKDSAEADVVCYLPIDTTKNARKFVELVHPKMALFVKYEFWPNFLFALKKQVIPVFLISALFRKNQLFFKPYGGWMRKSLSVFEHFFVQEEKSKVLLESIGFKNVIISGDTRFDRVSQQIEQDNTLEFIQEFKQDKICIVAGSTWPEDEDLLIDYMNKTSEEVQCIIAPHNIKPHLIQKLKEKITKKCVLYSEKEDKNLGDYSIFIIDTIGLLTKIYSYADIAYVGGAMGNTGLHNILEPATFGLPIIIGENFKKFPEAHALRLRAGLFSVSNFKELEEIVNKLIHNTSFREKTGMICSHYVSKNIGATAIILNYLKNKH